MDSTERKNKQEFLKKEILDRGYDREQFAEFMLNEREDGLNVDVWDFRELMMAVEDFISTHKPVANANNDIIDEARLDGNQGGNYSHSDQYNDSNEYAENREDDPYFQDDDEGSSPEKKYSEPTDYTGGRDYDDSTPETHYENPQPTSYQDYNYDREETPTTYSQPESYEQPGSYNQPEAYEEPDHSNRESEYDIYTRQTEKIMEMRKQDEDEREKIRQREKEEEIKQLKDQKKTERDERKNKKKEKREAKNKKLTENKSAIEAELEEALKNENMPKSFSEMTPKTTIDFKNRKDKLPGVVVPKTKLNGEDKIRILIWNPEIVDEGFFLGKHLTFSVQTAPFGWKVKRKDKDFNILRDYLVKAYPHILVPMWPEHHSTKSIDKNFLRKREHLLNKFMNKCMQQEELKGCPILVDFLNYEGNEYFFR